MKDPTEYSNIGEEYVLDEQERQTRLSNDMIEHIEMREAAPQEEQMALEQDTAQAATAAPATPAQESPAPSTETSPYKDAEGNIDLEQIRKEGAELDSAAIRGVIDTATDFANFVLPDFIPEIPKASPYENKVAQTVRAVSSIVLPTMGVQSLGMRGAASLQAKAVSKLGAANPINRLGNTAFMKFVGERGIEAGASVAVGAVASEYEEDNLTGMLKKNWPATWDFIPDN